MEICGRVLSNINHILGKVFMSFKDLPQIDTKNKTQETERANQTSKNYVINTILRIFNLRSS